jgi:ketol-acid reductoisomerase
MMDRSNPSKVEAYRLAEELKDIMPVVSKKAHDNISGVFEKHDDRLG